MDSGEALGRWVFLALCVSMVIYLLATNLGASPPMIACESLDCLPVADLSAQQNMASATWWMTGIALLSSIIAVVTLYAVVANLEEARKVTREATRSAAAAEQALIDARETAKMQTRAYLAVTGVRVTLGGEYDTELFISVVNAGQSPARHMEISATVAGQMNSDADDVVHGQMVFNHPWESVFDNWTATATSADLASNQQRVHRLQVLEEFSAENEARMRNFATYRLTLSGKVVYFDVFGDRHIEAFDYVLDLISELDFPWNEEREMERAPGVPRHV